MERIVNIDLLSNPYNWLVVWLMVALAGLGATYLNSQMNGN